MRRSPAPRFGPRGSVIPRFGPRTPSSFGHNAPYRGPGYYNSGRHFFGRGRIDRIVPYHGGYRVFLGGWGYPFFVPYRFWDPFRFRVGLFIGLNAFYDPLGYYSVYGLPAGSYYAPGSGDDRYDDDRYSDDESLVRGIVRSIDLHTGYVTIEEEGSNRTITALLPPRDRRVDDIRVGDYVEFSGEWTRRYFDAARMERFEPRR